MLSSGTAAIATSGAGTVTLFTLPASTRCDNLIIINNGIAGSFSIDGTNFAYLPGTQTLSLYDLPMTLGKVISIKRTGASDMTGVYAMAW